ncbi:MAG: ATP-binding cassette domain-containing protein [Methylococcaceae bacterium]|nr:ATP-binding cassette domain-containing protein [Methylococcaceae bacterium]
MTGIRIDVRSKLFKAEGKAKKHLAIKDLEFSVASGEFSCLVGPSGCGKTTLLNIVAGLDRHFEGRIAIGAQHKRPLIGYVFQEPRLLPWRTVRQNVEFALQPGRPHEAIDELLSALGLEHVQQVYPERLSLGMSRRVALARAFVIRPDLLLMDEPFVSLDAPTARKVRTLLAEVWNKRPHTVLFVTHNVREAIMLADRLVFLSYAPGTVIGEVPVSIARCDRNREEAIEEFRQNLLSEHPEIGELL